MGSPIIVLLHYNVSVYHIVLENSTEMLIKEISTSGNETHANITGLQPGMSFRIQVAGVVSLRNLNIIGLGQRSASIFVNTSIAGKNTVHDFVNDYYCHFHISTGNQRSRTKFAGICEIIGQANDGAGGGGLQYLYL